MPNNTVRADGETVPAANHMNRRHALLFTAGFGFPTAIQLIPRENGPGELRSLFDQWKAIVEEGCRHMTDAQLDERCQRYSALQDQIAALKPRTAAELAMQFYVATDRGESHCPDEFMSVVKALIGV